MVHSSAGSWVAHELHMGIYLQYKSGTRYYIAKKFVVHGSPIFLSPMGLARVTHGFTGLVQEAFYDRGSPYFF